jgi:hypothetical protein
MIFLRRLIGRFLFVAVLGWLIRKLRGHENPKVQKVGATANRALGGAFGLDPNDPSLTQKPRRMRRSVPGAAVGGLMSYFFDPAQGSERRAKVKRFASEQMSKARASRPQLPAPAYGSSAPIAASPSASTIT